MHLDNKLKTRKIKFCTINMQKARFFLGVFWGSWVSRWRDRTTRLFGVERGLGRVSVVKNVVMLTSWAIQMFFTVTANFSPLALAEIKILTSPVIQTLPSKPSELFPLKQVSLFSHFRADSRLRVVCVVNPVKHYE